MGIKFHIFSKHSEHSQTTSSLITKIHPDTVLTARHITHLQTERVKMYTCVATSSLCWHFVIGAKLIYLSRMYNDGLFLKAWKSSSAHGFKAGVALVNTAVSDCI